MSVETVFLSAGLAFIREALVTEVPVTISSFTIGSSAGFDGDSDATAVSGTLVYSGVEAQVSTASDLDGNLVFSITLGEEIGTFAVGNVMLFAADANGGTAQPLLHIILPSTLPKNATVGADPGNTLSFRASIAVFDGSATTSVNITVANENIGVLPSIADENLLPAPGPSAYQHYVIQNLTATNAPALAMRRVADETWWGNGNVQRIDDHRFGWAWGGLYGDAYAVLQLATTWGGFFSSAAPDFTQTIDGGAAWAAPSITLDGGTWT